jgi:pimeloyl-ACP methyl ester carboxylesterase
MSQDPVQVLHVDGRAIATLVSAAPHDGGPGLFWLPGFRSDMASTKASMLAAFAQGRCGYTRFDYSGHGRSGGRFEDGTIGAWLDEAVQVFTRLSRGPQIVIGSSMGGYIALLMLRRLLTTAPEAAARVRAMVLIAPAFDMTEDLMWAAFSPAQQQEVADTGQYLRPSEYGAPYVITRRLIEEGRRHLIGAAPFDPGRPVHILQGLLDDAVPAAHTRRLLTLLPGGHVTFEDVVDGDHRLSRPQDLARLTAVLERMLALEL